MEAMPTQDVVEGVRTQRGTLEAVRTQVVSQKGESGNVIARSFPF